MRLFRGFLRRFVRAAVVAASTLTVTAAWAQINRRALVERHNVVLRNADPWSPLSVGNGEFAFTADVTGLQTFPGSYGKGIPLATQSQWGWHTFPNPEDYRLEDTFESYDTGGHPVDYPTRANTPAGQWLRANPHRLGLAHVGLVIAHKDEREVDVAELEGIEQTLDLWSGTLRSQFAIGGELVEVLTWAHPSLDMIAVRVKGPSSGVFYLGIRIKFPYGIGAHMGDPVDWEHPERHRTVIVQKAADQIQWRRRLDSDEYFVRAEWSPKGAVREVGRHHYVLDFDQNDFELVVAFSPSPFFGRLPGIVETEEACRKHWANFWSQGGAVDFSGSKDPRARELERRVVLSQYLTAIQCAGSLPPQETGLTFNSWYGKFHLEMHWWHAAHFVLWGRSHLLERSLSWYRKTLPMAQHTARRQGYRGARWPKMVGPGGRESPSGIGPLLIWQQPHLIHFLELLYRERRDRRFLEQYKDLVHETAEFMASFPLWEQETQRYVLGPPLIPAQEIHPPRTTRNPTFELAYWKWGLATAQKWRERLGLERNPEWDRVLRRLSDLPVVNGLYVNAESDPWTFEDPQKRRDHPTLLAALGMLPGAGVDHEIMRDTLRRVLETWDWARTWGWDYPMVAMTAARLGEPVLAVDALLMDSPKNRYLANGHNHQTERLSIYLPGNGGLLTAVAMMAAGWDGAPDVHAPGFPRDGSWVVRWEGLRRLP